MKDPYDIEKKKKYIYIKKTREKGKSERKSHYVKKIYASFKKTFFIKIYYKVHLIISTSTN